MDEVRNRMRALLRERQEPLTRLILATQPSLRDSGTPTALMIGGSVSALVRIANDVVARLAADDRERASAWLSDFMGTYIAKMLGIWETKRG